MKWKEREKEKEGITQNGKTFNERKYCMTRNLIISCVYRKEMNSFVDRNQ